MTFVKFNAISGTHIIRTDLIIEISDFLGRVYAGAPNTYGSGVLESDLVDAKSKLVYNTGQIIYFEEDAETIISRIKESEQWEVD